ncbi:MAG: alpha/beta hydrolase [Burkholderiales bacterium]|nr:alpha/beta hydrolase [Burkholderiales bacterium]
MAHTTRSLPHGIDLSCRTCGPADGRLLVFLHGFPEAAFVWDEVMHHFALPANGGYRCVAPNLRGYERSSAPAEASAYRAKHLVEDVAELIKAEREATGQPLAALVAHDWGGAVAWSLAALLPELLRRLVIINSPHPATFLRELKHSAQQQAASAYMNFLARPDAPALLAADDYARLWPFFEHMGAANGPHAWLTPAVRDQYRAVWAQGLAGPCHYYAASPLRPATATDPGAAAVDLPDAMCRVTVPTQVIWAEADTALPPALVDGLDHWVPNLRLDRVANATHWVIHEQPGVVTQLIDSFLN